MSDCAVSSDSMTRPDLVDRHLIAERLGVPIGTVDKWKRRGRLPEPDYPELKNPTWRWTTIRDWAKRTGRLAA
jgi:hypothetical protein